MNIRTLRRATGWLPSLAVALVLAVAMPAAACTGDCDGNGEVAVNELLQGVNIALGNQPMSVCPVFDAGGDNQVTISELLTAVRAALDGCPAPIITTIAGTGIAGITDEGIPPIESNLYLPQDVTVGPDGYLYVVDWNNHRIRRIKDGVFETVAGTGELGDAQDGIALYTQFNHPTNIAFDHQGRMIIAAWHNSLVKRLDFTTGLVTNLAGTGARAFSGDGGPGNEATLDLPSSVVIDSNDNIIISDQANYRLRILEPNGIINTFAGTGIPGSAGDEGPALQAQLNGPKGQSAAPASRIAIDGRNRIFIADTGNHKIRMIDEVGIIHTVVGTGDKGYSGDNGPALEATLDTPSDVAVAPNGTLYIADTMNNVVRVVNPAGIIHTFAGTGGRGFSGDGGPATAAELDRPYGVGLAPNGDVYIADTHNQRIRHVSGVSLPPPPTPRPTPPPEIIPCTDVVGSICTFAGTGGVGYDGEGKNRLLTTLYWPFDISFLSNGRRILLDWNNHKVREILPDDTIQTIAGSDFVGDGPADLSDLTPDGAPPLTVDLNHPTDVLEFPNHDVLFMAWHNHKIRVIDHETGRVRVLLGAGAAFAGDGGPAKDARVNQPPHGTWDDKGNFFIIDQRNQRIRVIYDFATQRENAIIDTIAGTGTAGFNGDGSALTTQLNFPAGGNPEPSGGLAFGPDGALYFSDTNNDRVRKIVFGGAADYKDGEIVTIAGTGERGFSGDGGSAIQAKIAYPQDLEFGPDGNLYFADTNNHRVRMVNPSTGVITTVAGSGEKGYAGDGGPALQAELDRPFGVAFDDQGDLYISDTFNSRIRKVKR
jgi:sugar lactone lactonase YvrE